MRQRVIRSVTMGHESIDESTIEKISDVVNIADVPLSGVILDIGGGGEGIIGQQYGQSVIAIDKSKEELEEAPGGPIKIVMDATSMTFVDNTFDTATLFFTLMYMDDDDIERTLAECKRVLSPGGELVIWDMEIPENKTKDMLYYAIYLEVNAAGSMITTGYGRRWNKTQTTDAIAEAARKNGLEVTDIKKNLNHFVMTCRA